MADTFEEDLLALLEADDDLNEACEVIAWEERPQASALPALILTVIDEVRSYTFGGTVSLVQSRVQCDMFAASKREVLDLDRIFLPVVSGYRGTVGGTVFDGIFVVSRFSSAEEVAGSSTPLRRISRDLMVHHKEGA